MAQQRGGQTQRAPIRPVEPPIRFVPDTVDFVPDKPAQVQGPPRSAMPVPVPFGTGNVGMDIGSFRSTPVMAVSPEKLKEKPWLANRQPAIRATPPELRLQAPPPPDTRMMGPGELAVDTMGKLSDKLLGAAAGTAKGIIDVGTLGVAVDPNGGVSRTGEIPKPVDTAIGAIRAPLQAIQYGVEGGIQAAKAPVEAAAAIAGVPMSTPEQAQSQYVERTGNFVPAIPGIMGAKAGIEAVANRIPLTGPGNFTIGDITNPIAAGVRGAVNAAKRTVEVAGEPPEVTLIKSQGTPKDLVPEVARKALTELKGATTPIHDFESGLQAIDERMNANNSQMRAILEPVGDHVIPGSRQGYRQAQIDAIPETVRMNADSLEAAIRKIDSDLPDGDFTIRQLNNARQNLQDTQSPFFGKNPEGQMVMDRTTRATQIAAGDYVRGTLYDTLDNYGVQGGQSLGDIARDINQNRIGPLIELRNPMNAGRTRAFVESNSGGFIRRGIRGIKSTVKASGADDLLAKAVSRWTQTPEPIVLPFQKPMALLPPGPPVLPNGGQVMGSSVTGVPAELAVPESVRQSTLGGPTPRVQGGFLGQLESGRLQPQDPLGQLSGQTVIGTQQPQPTGLIGQLSEPRMSPQPPTIRSAPGTLADLERPRPSQSQFLDQLSGRQAPDVIPSADVPSFDITLQKLLTGLQELLAEKKPIGRVTAPKPKPKRK